MCNVYVHVYMLQVFSDVYAVLNKKWKENHHERLCQILANVESECKVEVSFEKGAYHFRGTLKAVSNVLKKLKSLSSESVSSHVFTASSDIKQCDAQQHEEVLSGEEDPGQHVAEVNSGSNDVITAQPKSCNEENIAELACAPDLPPGRENAADEHIVNVKTSTSEDKAVKQKTQSETEQMEQAESPPLTTSTDHVINDQSFQSALDVPHSGDSVHPVTAAADEEHCHNDEQHYNKNIPPQTDSSLSSSLDTEKSLQTKENCQALDSNAGVDNSTMDVSDNPDTQQSHLISTLSTDETGSAKVEKHEQKGLEASDTSFLPSAASDNDVGHNIRKELPVDVSTKQEQRELEASHRGIPADTNNPEHETKMSVLNESSSLQTSTTHGLATPATDNGVRNNSKREMSADDIKVSVYARPQTDSST